MPLALDTLTWPEVHAEQERGRRTVVMAFGATEQHGPHLPLATDALIGDHLAGLVPERLEAFLAPTVRIGCSSHHLAFPGTLSFADATFHGIVGDVVRSLARGGFERAILLPTHGGNFGPMGAALEHLGPVGGIEVRAMTDIRALMAIAQAGADEHGVPLGDGGLHAGEWETSMLMAIRPDLVRADARSPGFTGDLETAMGAIFSAGVDAIADNGVIGDPAEASAEHGARYWELVLDIALRSVS